MSRGRISLDRSGVATIPAGQTSVVLPLGVNQYAPVTAASFVLISPNADIGTRRLWWTKNLTAGTITIRMSSTRNKPTRVSWVLFG